MATFSTLQLSYELGIFSSRADCRYSNHLKGIIRKNRACHLDASLSSCALRQEAWRLHFSSRYRKIHRFSSLRASTFTCRSSILPSRASDIPIMKAAAVALTKSYNALHGKPLLLQLIPALGVIAFAVWGLVPFVRLSRKMVFRRNDNSWKKSSTYYVLTSYLQPMLLWIGATLICRVLDPVVLPTEASQVVKQRLLNFVRSLSTVLAFAYCLSSLIQQSQKFFMEGNDSNNTRNMGYDFAGKAVYTAVWVAAVSLFMELLGFSTQKWITAGGLGTVLLTLAGREIFTNFLSSVMIHATRPFVLNEWIQTKIEGYEVSGTVEHVGWWSPTIIRGDDREAVHIPNHKFTVNVVRNLSQKTHWRIKTHLAISHLDVNKISNIVADMRKVLAKNPQVEQQRLHRRVFLDNIDPENQALLIMISCFVKTSHFEEYLCVKEAILLDLLRVISHHRARLATPIRTVQKIYGDANIENVPFSESIFTRSGAASSRPFLLIDSSSRINGDDKTKIRPSRSNEENDAKTGATSNSTKTARPGSEFSSSQTTSATKQTKKTNSIDGDTKSTKAESQPSKLQLDGDEPMNPSSKDDTQLGGVEKTPDGEKKDAISKSESDKQPAVPPPPTRPILEENIVLGVALEGSKRTLPIEDDEMGPLTTADSKELAALRNANGPSTSAKDKKDGQSSVSDQRDQER